MQIIPDVYLVNGIPYGQHQNGYVVRLGDTFVMVDSGDLEHPTFDLVVANCARWGIAVSDISHLLVTHSHFDHASHAAALQRRGVQIVTNRAGSEALATGDDRCVGYAVNGVFEPCKVDAVVADGDELVIGGTRIRCIEVPGHADSCVVYEVHLRGERLWFVGDVILTTQNWEAVELGWVGGPDYSRATYVESLRRLAHMPCDHLFPGHGPAAIGGAKRLVAMAYTKAMIELR
jgi:glyoxylase-like metal-dependent hydrolase (beta-lactamase superfamily II)